MLRWALVNFILEKKLRFKNGEKLQNNAHAGKNSKSH